jgi:hypothetical protein
MTRALPFTQASVLRRISAAQKAGLRVTGIGPDGTVLTDTGESDNSDGRLRLAIPPKPRDAREKFGPG